MADEPLRLTPAQKKKFMRDVSNRPRLTPDQKKAKNERKRQAREDRINAGTSGGDIGSGASDISAAGVVGSAVTGGTVKGTNVGKKTKASKASKPKQAPAIAPVVDSDSGKVKPAGKDARKTVGSTRTDKTSEKIPTLSVDGPIGVRLEGKGGMPVTDEAGKIQRRESGADANKVRGAVVSHIDDEGRRVSQDATIPPTLVPHSAEGMEMTGGSVVQYHKVKGEDGKDRVPTVRETVTEDEAAHAANMKFFRSREEAATSSGTHSVCTDCFTVVPHHRIHPEKTGRNGGVCTDCAENY